MLVLDPAPVRMANANQVENVSINTVSDAAKFIIYPNPVTNANAMLQFIGVEKGVYQVEVYNSDAIKRESFKIHHEKGNKSYPISFNNSVMPGIYTVSITNIATGKVISLQCLIGKK
jgi:hypothetical protein